MRKLIVSAFLLAAVFALAQSVLVDGSSEKWSGHSVVRFADAEVPGGTIDGSNQAFMLAHPPSPAPSLILTRNGMVLKQGTDYTVQSNVVTFIFQQTPEGTDILLAWYRYK